MTETHNDNILINDTADEVQLVVKGASTQTEALQEWQDNSGTVLSKIGGDGQVIHNKNVIINDPSNEEQLVVKGASTQAKSLQEWQDNSGTVLSNIDADGNLLVGDPDGTIDALIEAHNIDDSNKPSRGLHSKGSLTGTLSSLVSWVVQELNLKGTGGISALHRALRVQATNENTGAMAAGADVRAGDFEVINTGGNATNNLEMSALVAKVNNQLGATLDTAYGLKVEIDDAGSSNKTYAIYTDNGVVHLGDLLELVAGAVFEDSAVDGVIGITPRSVVPTIPTSGMMYLDDGANRADGLVGFRRWNGSSWNDIMDTSSIGDGNVSGPGSSIDNAIARFDSTAGKLLQNSGATLDDSNNLTVNSILPSVDVTVADGGTGASNASDARTNLDAQEDLSGATLTAVTVATGDKVLIQDTSDNDNLKTVTVQSIVDLGGGSSPSGAIIAFAGSSAPTGWLMCDGAAVSRTTYSDLYAIQGDVYGNGDGSTTFNVPDMRGRTGISAGTGSGLTARTLGDEIGEEDHTLTISELASHHHVSGSRGTQKNAGKGGDRYPAGQAVTTDTGGDSPHNNMQPSLVINYIIKT